MINLTTKNLPPNVPCTKNLFLQTLVQNEEVYLTPQKLQDLQLLAPSETKTCGKSSSSLITGLPEKYYTDDFPLWNVTLLGKIVHIRKLSKKIMFLDIRVAENSRSFCESNCTNLGESHPDFDTLDVEKLSFENKIEVLLRSDEIGDKALLDCRYFLKISDIVLVQGFLEHSSRILALHALDIIMVKKRFWAGTSLTDADSDLKSKISYQPERPEFKTELSAAKNGLNAEDKPEINIKGDLDKQGQESTSESTKPCKYWVNSKYCPKGVSCHYFHPEGIELSKARKHWIMERKRQRLEQSNQNPDSHEDKEAGVKQSKCWRAKAFAQFLIDTYGEDYLRTGKGILDIAGGRGEISFELFTKRTLPVTLVDPRPRKLSKHQHKYMKMNPGVTLSPHIQDFFKLDDPSWNSDNSEKYSLVIGMHPDQATELIVDYGLSSKTPFAVVPCCVFARDFPGRSLNGNPVLNYDDLFEYLEKKSVSKSEFKVLSKYLNFEGRNKVLYTVPESKI